MIILLLIMSALQLNASVLGLLDSGADPNHEIFSKHVFINKAELKGLNNIDDDKNGYIDDIKGWNFIEESNRPFNENLYDYFGKSFYKYYAIREKKALETWSSAEESWYKKKRKDHNFLEELKKFRSYIHGSHVLGIALKRNHKKYGEIKFINIKYLGKAEKGRAKEPEYSPLKSGSKLKRINHLKTFINQYNTWQEGKLFRAIDYVCQKADVVNGSWGKSWKSSVKVVTKWYELEFIGTPDQEVIDQLSRLFLNNLIKRTSRITSRYPDILFVFSAGNTKSNNDEFPHYPSDARGNNIIAVGASWLNQRTKSSNFGRRTVDIFAPGFLISSSTPQNRVLKTTGTSQAAPHISHAALVIKNINTKLSAPQIKKIILQTSDKALAFISVSGGQLNQDRAYRAALLSKKLSLYQAIKTARRQIKDKTMIKGLKVPRLEAEPLLEAF